MYLWTNRLTGAPQGRAGMDGRAGSGGSVKAARRNTGFWPKDILSPTETAYRLLTAYKRGPLSRFTRVYSCSSAGRNTDAAAAPGKMTLARRATRRISVCDRHVAPHGVLFHFGIKCAEQGGTPENVSRTPVFHVVLRIRRRYSSAAHASRMAGSAPSASASRISRPMN